jgi:hypothetical protein
MRGSKTAHIGVGHRKILLARKQQGHVYRHPGENRGFDGGHAFGGTRNLHIQIGAVGELMNLQGRIDGRPGVARQKRRDFHRYPPVGTAGAIVYRTKYVGGAAQILERELEEQRLAGEARACFLLDSCVVGRAVADGLVENRRIRGQSGHRQFVHVATQGAIVEYLARDVVEPKALSQIVQGLCGFHRCTLKSDELRVSKSPMRSITRSGRGCLLFDSAASA